MRFICSLIALCLAQLIFAPGAQARTRIRQDIRTVTLDPRVKVHPVEVVASPSMTTTLRLPDGFEAHNVLCGQCIEILPGGPSVRPAELSHDPRNWVIEKHVEEKSIHLRPAKLPSSSNPASAFESNIFISLAGGHALNITLRLLDLDADTGETQLGADAVVNLVLPDSATLSGKLRQERQKMLDHFDNDVADAAHKLFLQRLYGEIRCRRAWDRPHRTDQTVVRIKQLCSRLEDPKTFWVMFEVENRSAADLLIERVELEPESAVPVVQDPLQYHLEKNLLAFAEKSRGMALVTLAADAQLPSSWRLRLTPGSPDRQPTDIEHLVF
jgi:hypothetical protein